MADPLKVRDFPTRLASAQMDKPILRQRAFNKLNEIQREAAKIQQATNQLINGLRPNTKAADLVAERAKQDLRNWALSLIESVGYVERVIGIGVNSVSEFSQLASNAAKLGFDRGLADERL